MVGFAADVQMASHHVETLQAVIAPEELSREQLIEFKKCTSRVLLHSCAQILTVLERLSSEKYGNLLQLADVLARRNMRRRDIVRLHKEPVQCFLLNITVVPSDL